MDFETHFFSLFLSAIQQGTRTGTRTGTTQVHIHNPLPSFFSPSSPFFTLIPALQPTFPISSFFLLVYFPLLSFLPCTIHFVPLFFTFIPFLQNKQSQSHFPFFSLPPFLPLVLSPSPLKSHCLPCPPPRLLPLSWWLVSFICLLDPLCLLPYLPFPSFYSFILATVANAINPPFNLMML
ncbi:hypothetical protein BKA57DRAFT_322149 [Linnemannia elongata]|nr:hypothetical protein BKA57DRAFT_322149 [Linnemannia elongata]